MRQKHISHAGLPQFTLGVKMSLSYQMGLCLLFAASIWPKESSEAPNLASPDCLNSPLYVTVLGKFIIAMH